MIDTITPYIKNIDGSIRSFTRGDDKTDGRVSKRFDSLSDYWVDTITNSFDQDISAMWVGNKGTGKSSAVLSVCYHSAIKIAEWRNDGSKWEDYYNLHTLTACILEEDATRLMNIQEPYICKNYDDIGIGWSARDWQDEENQQKNDVFQINRTDRAIQCFSVPNQFLLDKVPRSLVNHYIEMDHQLFNKGFTTIKLFKPKTMFRESKIINPFLVVDRNKFVNYLIPSPPHDLWQEYKKLRNKNKDIAIRRRADAKVKKDEMTQKKRMLEAIKIQKQEERLLKPKEEKGPNKTETAHKRWNDQFALWQSEFIEMKRQKPDKPMTKILALVGRLHGADGRAIAYWRSEELIKKYGLDKYDEKK